MYKKTVLLTGSTGLIGRELLGLFPSHWKIFAVSRVPFQSGLANVENIIVDLAELDKLTNLPTNVDHVIHLAQSSRFREFPEEALDILDVNVRSTVALLNYARECKVKSFVLASSGGIYGYRDSGFHEHEPVHGNSALGFYLNSRVAAEALADSYQSFFPVIVLRYFFAYGPAQRQDMLIPRLLKNIKLGNPIQLNGPDGVVLNPIYVEDAARATLHSLELRDNEKINIAGPDVASLREICSMIGERVGREPNFVQKSGSEVSSLIGDTSKMQALLGKSEYSLQDGLAKMCESLDR
jgi:nucleoside-diphosphate-sugar epimerase